MALRTAYLHLQKSEDTLGRKLDEPLVAGVGRCGGIGRSSADSSAQEFVSPLSTTTTAEAGCIFKASCIEGVLPDAVTPDAVKVRAWDRPRHLLSCTNNPDWTVGLKLAALPNGTWAVMDLVRDVAARGQWKN